MKIATMSRATAARSLNASSQRPRGTRTLRWQRFVRFFTPYLFVLPFLLLFLAFFLLPFAYTLWLSFFAEHRSGLGLGPPQVVWAGAENYLKALHDPAFWDSIKRVLIFGAVQIPIEMLLALALAFLMDSALIRLRRFFRLAFFVPYAVPGVVATIMWGFFYSPGFSPIVHSFVALHLPAPDFLGPNTVLWSIANISTWEFTGYNMVIFFSALQALPQEIYEAGRLDGLSEAGIALRLKLPLIRPALLLGVLFAMIGTLQLFNEPKILTSVSHAITTTYTPNILAYNIAFVQTNYYYGGAIAVILGAITFVCSFAFMRLTRQQSGGL